MTSKNLRLVSCAAAALFLIAPAAAQDDKFYDGEKLTGMIDPGRNSYRFDDATHDAPNWKIEVATQNRAGEAIAFSAVMHEIGSPKRYMEGTWTQGGQEQPFKITRE